MMRLLLLVLPVALAFTGVNSHAAPALSRVEALRALAEAEPGLRRQAAVRLGEIGMMTDSPALLGALRDSDSATRERAEQALLQIWGRSGEPRIDRLFRTGVKQMNRGDLRQGVATFSRIITLKPNFAEGWNKRATLYFLLEDYDKSLADCAEVMKRNPYHFGALAGYGQIYLRLEEYQRALDYFRRALEINPNLDGVREEMRILERLIEEKRRNMV